MDGGGITGSFLEIGFRWALVGSALIVFIYCWHKGILSFDEGPKETLFEEER